MEVVKGLDVHQYMGRWYKIDSFPSFPAQKRPGHSAPPTL
ncbi:hypothetical protein LINGRAHAP2_LOCUS15006 [Linum grandiflorum]